MKDWQTKWKFIYVATVLAFGVGLGTSAYALAEAIFEWNALLSAVFLGQILFLLFLGNALLDRIYVLIPVLSYIVIESVLRTIRKGRRENGRLYSCVYVVEPPADIKADVEWPQRVSFVGSMDPLKDLVNLKLHGHEILTVIQVAPQHLTAEADWRWWGKPPEVEFLKEEAR